MDTNIIFGVPVYGDKNISVLLRMYILIGGYIQKCSTGGLTMYIHYAILAVWNTSGYSVKSMDK